MGRVGITGTNSGNSSLPQFSLEQKNYENLVNKISMQDLINELKNEDIKFIEKDIVFIKKDESSKTVWLEIGNEDAGLTHIIKNHAEDFEKALNVDKKQIPSIISITISCENLVNTSERIGKNGKTEIRKLYKYNRKYYLAISFGDNGFIVTSYPKKAKNIW